MISSGQPIQVERDNDKNPVVALREIAEQRADPEGLKEELIHSLQKRVEVDEPEADLPPASTAAASGDDIDPTFNSMSEEELLRAMETLVPPERTEEV